MSKTASVSYSDRTQTSATGASFVNLGATRANEVLIINASGVVIDLQVNSTVPVPLAIGASVLVSVMASLSEIQIRRNDQSNSQVYVHHIRTQYINN